MSFSARVLRVFIASPGDVARERELVEQAIVRWNRAGQAQRSGYVLLPVRWELDAVPQQGGDGQAIINRDLLENADIVIALFHSRLGGSTPRGVSGTAEEIETVRKSSLGTHVLVCRKPVPWDHDPDQLTALKAYQAKLSADGLLATFLTDDELQQLVDRILDADVERHRLEVSADALTVPSLDAATTARVFARVGRSLQRQEGVLADYLRTDVEVGQSDHDNYWLFSAHKLFRFRLTDGPVTSRLRVSIMPRAMMDLQKVSSQFSLRANPDWDFWDIQYWPALLDAGDWAKFQDGVTVKVSQSSSRQIQLPDRVVSVDETVLSEEHGVKQTGYSAEIVIDEQWDTLSVSARGLPYPKRSPSLHFYAGSICTGQWHVHARSADPNSLALRLRPICGPDVAVHTEVMNVGLVAATFRAGDVVLLPDDAITITVEPIRDAK